MSVKDRTELQDKVTSKLIWVFRALIHSRISWEGTSYHFIKIVGLDYNWHIFSFADVISAFLEHVNQKSQMNLLVNFLICHKLLCFSHFPVHWPCCALLNWNHCLLWLHKVAWFYATAGFPVEPIQCSFGTHLLILWPYKEDDTWGLTHFFWCLFPNNQNNK